LESLSTRSTSISDADATLSDTLLDKWLLSPQAAAECETEAGEVIGLIDMGFGLDNEKEREN
jgi:hypothetical protein